MKVQQIYTGCLAEAAYYIESNGVAAIIENVSYGWADDNLTIPLAVCGTMAVLYSICLPNLVLVLPNVPV